MTRTRSRTLVLALLAALACPAAAEDYSGLGYDQRQKLLEEHYARAIQYFNDGNFTSAIEHWQEILKIDPEQTSPPMLIKEARAKLTEQLGPLEKAMRATLDAGRYDEALAKLDELTEKDPTNPAYKPLRTKLTEIVEVKPSETGKTRVAQLVRKGVAAHLANVPDEKVAVNSLRYARDLAPNDAAVLKLAELLESQNPEVAKKEQPAPGMSVVEHKLFIALNHIYEGRYDLAIFACNEVLEIEPDNVLALKRKGSAYFALNQKDKARQIWQQAAKVAPQDAEIRKFLATAK